MGPVQEPYRAAHICSSYIGELVEPAEELVHQNQHDQAQHKHGHHHPMLIERRITGVRNKRRNARDRLQRLLRRTTLLPEQLSHSG